METRLHSFEEKHMTSCAPNNQLRPVLGCNIQVAVILNKLAFDSCRHVLNEVKRNWDDETANKLADNTLMDNWQQEAWNMISPGTHGPCWHSDLFQPGTHGLAFSHS